MASASVEMDLASRPLREGVGRNPIVAAHLKAEEVALYARAWVEIAFICEADQDSEVALYARAWVEIERSMRSTLRVRCRPLREGVGRNRHPHHPLQYISRRPLREGVGRNLK